MGEIALRVRRMLPLLLALAGPVPLGAEEVYGNKIEPKDVSESVELCEYDLLIEQQTCNDRINKSTCIKEIHRYCVDNYTDLPYPGSSGVGPTNGEDPEAADEDG